MCANLYTADLNAMPEEMLGFTSGKARSGFDFTSEVISVNKLVIGATKGVAFPTERPEGWQRAPEASKSKEAIIGEFTASIEAVLKALREAPAERLEEIVETPLGAMPVARLAAIVPGHLMYHSGQLNYIQTLHGDDEFHWS